MIRVQFYQFATNNFPIKSLLFLSRRFACLNDLVIIQTTQGLAKYVLECNKPSQADKRLVS